MIFKIPCSTNRSVILWFYNFTLGLDRPVKPRKLHNRSTGSERSRRTRTCMLQDHTYRTSLTLALLVWRRPSSRKEENDFIPYGCFNMKMKKKYSRGAQKFLRTLPKSLKNRDNYSSLSVCIQSFQKSCYWNMTLSLVYIISSTFRAKDCCFTELIGPWDCI